MVPGAALAVIGLIGVTSIALGTACATAPHPAAAAPGRAVPTASPGDEPRAGTDEPAEDEPDAPAPDADDTTHVAGEMQEQAGPCPADMALVEIAAPRSSPHRYCVDKYEASLVEVSADGTEQPFPHYLPVDGHTVRAVSRPSTFPQGYISEVQAEDACAASNKRLCNMDEWKTACMGPARTAFPYGDTRRPGVCHDTGKSAVLAVFGAKAVAASTPYAPAPTPVAGPAPAASGTGKRAHGTKGRAAQSTRPRATSKAAAANRSPAKAPHTGSPPAAKKLSRRPGKKGTDSRRPANVDPGVWAKLNDPGLGQVDGALSKTGEHGECVNGFGVFDMVGNLHEWVATDPQTVHGTFAGGYYLDTTINGDGCNYRTVAHAHDYHDYSTGFRCCAPADAGEVAVTASKGP
jgi:hypothetical protein